LSLLEHRLAEPVQRRISPSRRLAGGNQGAIAELGAEVPSGTRHFNRAIQRRAHGDPADRPGDVISRHGLKEFRWQPNRRAVSGFIGDALDEAGRTNERIVFSSARSSHAGSARVPTRSWQVRYVLAGVGTSANESLVMKYFARGLPAYFLPITRAKSSTELRGR
jgi:hypothetical protein